MFEAIEVKDRQRIYFFRLLVFVPPKDPAIDQFSQQIIINVTSFLCSKHFFVTFVFNQEFCVT